MLQVAELDGNRLKWRLDIELTPKSHNWVNYKVMMIKWFTKFRKTVSMMVLPLSFATLLSLGPVVEAAQNFLTQIPVPSGETGANLVWSDQNQTFTKGQATTPFTISGCNGSSGPVQIAGTESNTYICNLSGTAVTTIANPTTITPGYSYTFKFKQPASGGPSPVEFAADFYFPGGTVPTFSTTANYTDVLQCTASSSTEIDCPIFNLAMSNTTLNPPENLLLAAPTYSSNGVNYATGCLGNLGALAGTYPNHNCLNFDDHWLGGNLNTANWFPGLWTCQGTTNSTENCYPATEGYQTTAALRGVSYPFSTWCVENASGCTPTVFFDYPYFAYGSNPISGNTGMSIASGPGIQGVLSMPVTYIGNSPMITDTSCVTNTETGGHINCLFLNFAGAGLEAGGLTSPTNTSTTVANPLGLIPAAGGIVVARLKYSAGLSSGQDAGLECDAVDTANGISSYQANANIEMGFTQGGTALENYDVGVNNGTYQLGNSTTNITTGDDGVGSGDATNWHVYAIEWFSGSWYFYIDGVQVYSHAEPLGTPSVGWACSLTNFVAPSADAGYHSSWTSGNPGIFNMYVSDFQVYK